jgi:hypothetical protein
MAFQKITNTLLFFGQQIGAQIRNGMWLVMHTPLRWRRTIAIRIMKRTIARKVANAPLAILGIP